MSGHINGNKNKIIIGYILPRIFEFIVGYYNYRGQISSIFFLSKCFNVQISLCIYFLAYLLLQYRTDIIGPNNNN